MDEKKIIALLQKADTRQLTCILEFIRAILGES